MVQFTGEAFTAGVEELERNGVKLRVYGVAKMAVAAVLLLGDRKWHTFLDPVAPPQKHLRVKKKPEGFGPFRLRRWSPAGIEFPYTARMDAVFFGWRTGLFPGLFPIIWIV